MSEASNEQPAPTDQAASAQGDQSGDGNQQAAPADDTDWKAEARKWEQRAKENGTKAKTLEQQHRATMSEAERTIAEAEARGRTSAVTDFGKRIARTEFDAAAARRNPDYDTASALEYVDLTRFLGEDGEPDAKAIRSAVERLVPAPTGGTPSFDGGPRTTPAAPQQMSQIIRQAAGRT